MRWYIGLLILVALIVATGQPIVAQGTPVDEVAPEEEALIAAVWAYEEALEAGDIERLLTFFADEAYALPPDEDVVMGKTDIAEYMASFFDDKALEREFTLVDYTISGDYATRLGSWTNMLSDPNGGAPALEVGRCMFGYEYDGTDWKIIWQIWNDADDCPPALSHDGSPC